jgi:hypothetical protein
VNNPQITELAEQAARIRAAIVSAKAANPTIVSTQIAAYERTLSDIEKTIEGLRTGTIAPAEPEAPDSRGWPFSGSHRDAK